MQTQQPIMYPQLVIRFKRRIEFPRFAVNLGERWSFEIGPKSEALLQSIKSGERFPFAGGDCLTADVEILYEGPAGREHAIAAGYIANAAKTEHDMASTNKSPDWQPKALYAENIMKVAAPASAANVVKDAGHALEAAYPWGYRSTESSP